MNKIAIFISILLMNLYSIDMPPQIPNIENKMKNNIKKDDNNCELIPPMLYRLPLPLLKARDKCENILYMPDKEKIKKRLLKRGIKPKKIQVEYLKNCARIYKIKYWLNKKKSKTIYCNESLEVCFDKKPFKL